MMRKNESEGKSLAGSLQIGWATTYHTGLVQPPFRGKGVGAFGMALVSTSPGHRGDQAAQNKESHGKNEKLLSHGAEPPASHGDKFMSVLF